ncbi:HEAT repeat-containing protein 1 [Histomonas meleagridis]|uniref:HEAT repeat-containing protein 1 n=1 Tax=Histomonas meleagridis TaxID=135588 RepID=UPI00355A16F3|nr:HEAT repeat-containing protein 1 [Histomonas meleagridis]KAH0804056.1 HEAT repeat-containing protein 1 [Histomonas meleagridis]
MVKDSFEAITTTTDINALLMPFIRAFSNNKQNPNSIILLFKAFQNNIIHTNKDDFEDNHQSICKFFLLAFNTSYEDWDIMIQFQDAIISAFCTFLTQLNESLLTDNLNKFTEFFEKIMDHNQEDYITNRLFFVRTENAILQGLQKSISKFYGSILPIILPFLNETNDSLFNERQLTIECLQLIQIMAQYADDDFFDADRFNSVLNAIIIHANKVVTNVDEYIKLIILSIAPAFTALMDTTKDEMLWRSANLQLIEMMKNDDSRIKIGAMKIVDEEFKVIGGELTGLLPELVPYLAECAEYAKGDVDVIARETIQSIENSIGEPINTYFT